jgi:hypothetical protein
LFGAIEEAFRKRRAFSFARRPMLNSEDGNGDVSEAEKKLNAIRKGIALFEAKLEAGQIKVTASEYIRLLELLQQFDVVEPREIRIRWVDPSETTESNTEE